MRTLSHTKTTTHSPLLPTAPHNPHLWSSHQQPPSPYPLRSSAHRAMAHWVVLWHTQTHTPRVYSLWSCCALVQSVPCTAAVCPCLTAAVSDHTPTDTWTGSSLQRVCATCSPQENRHPASQAACCSALLWIWTIHGCTETQLVIRRGDQVSQQRCATVAELSHHHAVGLKGGLEQIGGAERFASLRCEVCVEHAGWAHNCCCEFLVLICHMGPPVAPVCWCLHNRCCSRVMRTKLALHRWWLSML